MAVYKTYIVTIRVNSNKGRQDLEEIENTDFNSEEDLRRVLCFDEDAPVATEDVKIYELTDFMDTCNNVDSDTPDEEEIDLGVIWIGYVQIKA